MRELLIKDIFKCKYTSIRQVTPAASLRCCDSMCVFIDVRFNGIFSNG